MAKKNLHQTIWKRNDDDSLTLKMPKIINTDISFQLMFGIVRRLQRRKQIDQKTSSIIHIECIYRKTHQDMVLLNNIITIIGKLVEATLTLMLHNTFDDHHVCDCLYNRNNFKSI